VDQIGPALCSKYSKKIPVVKCRSGRFRARDEKRRA
jgi:hypothetical protein